MILHLLFSAVLLLTFAPVSQAEHQCVYPVALGSVSSPYGMRLHPVLEQTRHHDGVDLVAPFSARVRAVSSGRVVFVGNAGNYGLLVVLSHGKEITTHYAHLSRALARIGESVTVGQVIALVGSSGLATGPHLHFELRVKGKPIDPEILFPGIMERAAG